MKGPFNKKLVAVLALMGSGLIVGNLFGQELPGSAEIEAAWQRLQAESDRSSQGMAANIDLVTAAADRMREDLAAEGIGHAPILPPDVLDGTEFQEAYRSLLDGENKTEGRVYVLLSFSMTPAALKSVVDEAHKARAIPVLRGFELGQYSAFARQIAEAGIDGDGIIVDPNVFRAFKVDAVPAFIASSSAVLPCEGLDCVPVAPSHDVVYGNISLGAALDILAREGRDAPGVANKALRILNSAPSDLAVKEGD